jgi:hypothetical protein
MKKQVAEMPPMNVKELREYLNGKPDIKEAIEILEEMKVWYFANCHLITIGEDAAFTNYLGKLEKYTLAA